MENVQKTGRDDNTQAKNHPSLSPNNASKMESGPVPPRQPSPLPVAEPAPAALQSETVQISQSLDFPGVPWFPSASLFSWVTFFVLALALALRLAWLGAKPPHFDEGVNGWFVDQMTRQGYYHYDPGNYHGPFHFYVLFLAETLFGRNILALRVPLVLINVVTIWLVLQFKRFLPTRACVITALAFAVSPGMLFYSRYSIHEAWLLFGMVLGFWGFAEMWTRGTARGLWCVAMGCTLMILTKETYIIHFVSFGLAVATLWVLERVSASQSSTPAVPQKWTWKILFNSTAVSLLLILFFYSGGFLDPKSLKGLIETFAAWFHTGVTGNGHEKSWYYWLELFGRYEWPAVIGLLFSLRALFPGMNRLSRLMAIYGCGVLVAYSIVPYKTPWCIISIAWPFLFLFGDAMNSLGEFLAARSEAAAGTSAICKPILAGAGTAVILGASLGWSARLNYFHPTDATEPYVYVQTTDDLFKLTAPLDKLVSQDPTAYHMIANILLTSYHPLPWVLGRFTAIGYYDKPAVQPPTMDAGFLLVDEDRIAKVESQLQQSYFVEPFQLRDAMAPGKLYLNYSRFTSVFPGRKADFDPQAPVPEEEGEQTSGKDKASDSAQAPVTFSMPSGDTENKNNDGKASASPVQNSGATIVSTSSAGAGATGKSLRPSIRIVKPAASQTGKPVESPAR